MPVAHHASAGKIYASLTSQNLLEISPSPVISTPPLVLHLANLQTTKSKIKTNHNRMIKRPEIRPLLPLLNLILQIISIMGGPKKFKKDFGGIYA
jgi:hypothetical protein